METWYKIDKEQAVDSPALLVYPERVKHNIALAIAMIGDVNRLRPHVKTHKTKEILQLQLDAGVTKFKCATIAEAEMLGECRAPDVLLAYPLYGPKLGRFFELIVRFRQTKFSVIVDNEDAATVLSEVVSAAGEVVDTYIDLNVGMGRTGIAPSDGALALYRLCASLEGISIKGFHAYDGHVREIDLEKRKAICDHNFEPVSAMVRTLESEGFDSPRIVMGGSPSFPVYAQYDDIECSPGTFVLWDKGYSDTLPEQKFLPAAVLLCRVVSILGPNRICVDLGYKAVAAENALERRVYFLSAPNLTPVSHSEEHLVLEAPTGHDFHTGDVLYALPIHICPTVALYDRLMIIERRTVKGMWTTVARKR